jgi:hypothetical protein
MVTMLAAVAAVSQVAYLDALSWHILGLAAPMTAQMRPPFLTLLTAHAIVSAVAGVLAVALVLNEGPRQSAARGLGLALGAWSYLTAYSGVTLLLRPDPGAPRSLFEAHFLAVEVAGLVGLLRFTALFPQPLADRSLEPPPTLPSGVRPFHTASVWMLGDRALWIVGLGVLGSLWGVTAARGLAIADAGLSPLMDVVRFAAAGLVVLNLRRSWSRADPEQAGRLAWLFIGLAWVAGALLLLIGGNVLLAVTNWPEPVMPWRPLLLDIGLIAFLVAVAMGILYRGTMDAAQTARRIGAFATVATMALFLAAALEALFTGGALGGGASLRTGVGTLVAFVILVSTHRGLVRSLERGLAQLMGPGGALT